MRGVYVEIGSVVCVIHLLITPVAKVWMRLGFQDKALRILGAQQSWEIFTGEETFLSLETIIAQSLTCAW